MNKSRPPFVLVHGTWLGGWIWQRLRPLLEAHGHAVFTPTLSGCGERHHLSRADVGLETHIDDILGVIEAEELQSAILVGHSFSGVAITGVENRLPARIAQMVYFDALVPRPGRMSGAPRNPDGTLSDYFTKRIPHFIDGYKMDFWADYPIEMLVNAGHADVEAMIRKHLTTHPMRGWSDELVLQKQTAPLAPRIYIHAAAQQHSPSSDAMPGLAKNNPAWRWIDLPIDRLGMLTNPSLVAKTLLQIANPRVTK
jgi:pimeloyl-ACP methyl ester carboxylesterase